MSFHVKVDISLKLYLPTTYSMSIIFKNKKPFNFENNDLF